MLLISHQTVNSFQITYFINICAMFCAVLSFAPGVWVLDCVISVFIFTLCRKLIQPPEKNNNN